MLQFLPLPRIAYAAASLTIYVTLLTYRQARAVSYRSMVYDIFYPAPKSWLTASLMRLNRSQVRISAVPLLGNNLRQVVHTRVHLSPSSIKGTGQGVVMHCGWGGNRRSGIALAMCRLQWFIHLRARTLRKGDEHPAYTPRGVWHSFSEPETKR